MQAHDEAYMQYSTQYAVPYVVPYMHVALSSCLGPRVWVDPVGQSLINTLSGARLPRPRPYVLYLTSQVLLGKVVSFPTIQSPYL